MVAAIAILVDPMDAAAKHGKHRPDFRTQCDETSRRTKERRQSDFVE
jgi:hypothetical protein